MYRMVGLPQHTMQGRDICDRGILMLKREDILLSIREREMNHFGR